MARARNIKPSFFKNEILGQADPLLGLLFISLWTLADKEGRLEDRPLRIKAETFPYRENIDINGYLTELQRLGFVVRYEVENVGFIEVVNFKKHQTPHSTEKKSEIPPVERGTISIQRETVANSASQLGNVKTTLGNASACVNPDINVLIPDSLIPDSLIPDSLIPDSLEKPFFPALSKKRKSPPKVPDENREVHREVWKSYSDAYFNRYGTEPVRNQMTNRNVVDFCKRIPMEEAPHIARWFVTHSDAYYVRQMHPLWALLKDAEKIRTEWATGRAMTQTKARQTDRVGNMASIVEKIIADRGGEQ